MNHITRVILEQSHDCDCCGAPLFPGEVAYNCRETNAIGCSQDHAETIAEDRRLFAEVEAFRIAFEFDLIGGVA